MAAQFPPLTLPVSGLISTSLSLGLTYPGRVDVGYPLTGQSQIVFRGPGVWEGVLELETAASGDADAGQALEAFLASIVSGYDWLLPLSTWRSVFAGAVGAQEGPETVTGRLVDVSRMVVYTVTPGRAVASSGLAEGMYVSIQRAGVLTPLMRELCIVRWRSGNQVSLLPDPGLANGDRIVSGALIRVRTPPDQAHESRRTAEDFGALSLELRTVP